MYLRQDLDTTLGDLQTMLRERGEDTDAVRVESDKIEFHLDAADPSISLGDTEVPATEHALATFGDLLQIPSAFLKRASGKVQTETMNSLFNDMTRNTLLKDARVIMRGNFLDSIEEWGKEKIQPVRLVDAAINVVGSDAPLHRIVDTPQFFGFDVHVHEDAERGVYGEGTVKGEDDIEVNDLAAGGLRMGLDIKHGLAPTVEEILYRYWCTNGMVAPSSALKLDARGQTIDEVVAELESLAQIAFSRAESDLHAFYDLKQQRIDNPERALRQMARERGIPDRSLSAMMDLAVTDLPDEVSMFDLVNLVTNFANSPSISRDGGRTILEAAGGAAIADHASRCSHCLQKVGH